MDFPCKEVEWDLLVRGWALIFQKKDLIKFGICLIFIITFQQVIRNFFNETQRCFFEHCMNACITQEEVERGCKFLGLQLMLWYFHPILTCAHKEEGGCGNRTTTCEEIDGSSSLNVEVGTVKTPAWKRKEVSSKWMKGREMIHKVWSYGLQSIDQKVQRSCWGSLFLSSHSLE